jgi:hypothetical protein
MIERASANTADPVLSFEEFSARGDDGITPRYVNFDAYFGNGMAGDIYRDTPQFAALAAKDPQLAEELCSEVMGTVSNIKFRAHEGKYGQIAKHEPRMYQAYIAMRQAGFSDAELFC